MEHVRTRGTSVSHGRSIAWAVVGALSFAFAASSAPNAAARDEGPPPPRLLIGNGNDSGVTKVMVATVELPTGPARKRKVRLLTPFGKKGKGAKGAARVAGGNLNGDFFPDLVVGRGKGRPPQIRSFEGRKFRKLAGPLGKFNAFQPNFLGGVYVARGDINRDGTPDVVVSVGGDAAPQVNVFNGLNGQQIRFFNAYDPSFLGGVRVATGDVNGDGFDDIITGAGPGGGPHVRVFSGENNSVLHDFDAFDPGFNGGIFVASSDVDGDGLADVVVGAGAGGPPQVRVFRGGTGAEICSFFAFPTSFTSGVTVAAGDFNGDGRADLVAGQAGDGGLVRIFDGTDCRQLDSFFAFGNSFTGGVFVAYAH